MPNKVKKKVLIIACNSFSGSHFTDYLLSKGLTVFGIARRKNISSIFLPYINNKFYDKNFFFKKIDLNKNLNSLIELIQNEKFTYIINFAAQSMVAESWQYPDHWYQTNVLTQVKFHDAIRKFNFIKKYIHVSTPEVYGSTSSLIKENFNFNPSTPYAVSRASCDMHLMSFFKNYNFPVIFTRSANVYGPGQQLYRIIPKTVISATMNEKMQLHGGGNSQRSFIHIKDVCEAKYKLLIKGNIGETYHISNNQLISIKTLVEMIFDKLNKRFDKHVIISSERAGKDMFYKLDSTKIISDLKWKCKIDLNKGIDQVVNWVSQNKYIISKLSKNYTHIK